MAKYCEIILIRGGQCSFIVKILLVREDVISRVNAWSVIPYYNARHIITLLNVRGDVNSWVKGTYEIHEHQTPTNNNESTVLAVFISESTIHVYLN